MGLRAANLEDGEVVVGQATVANDGAWTISIKGNRRVRLDVEGTRAGESQPFYKLGAAYIEASQLTGEALPDITLVLEDEVVEEPPPVEEE